MLNGRVSSLVGISVRFLFDGLELCLLGVMIHLFVKLLGPLELFWIWVQAEASFWQKYLPAYPVKSLQQRNGA